MPLTHPGKKRWFGPFGPGQVALDHACQVVGHWVTGPARVLVVHCYNTHGDDPVTEPNNYSSLCLEQSLCKRDQIFLLHALWITYRRGVRPKLLEKTRLG